MTEDPGQTDDADPGSGDSTNVGGMPNTPSAGASAPLPKGDAVESTHNGGLINNGNRSARVMITATLDDGQGNSPTTGTAMDVTPGSSATFQPVTVRLPFSNYQSGTTLTFTATTTVTDGTTTANDVQQNSITVP
jgi:hypothetical protein